MNPVEEIKSRLPIEQVIADYIPLKRAGTNFKALCPFHQEKTPSFMVSSEKQIWHCFGCNEGGDIFSFIERYEGLEFKEVIQQLAQRAGVTLRDFHVSSQSKKRVLYDINDAAREYYVQVLQQSKRDAVLTREYLASRGMKPEAIASWSLGLASDTWDDLHKFLSEKKFKTTDILEAGLIIEREQKSFDRFRRRLMFPIRDVQGRTVGFTARTLQRIVYQEEDQAGKYINTPQTPIYNKSQILYGFDSARHEIKRLNYAIAVEGNMDVIMSHQAGVKNVVGVSGTALTLDQLKLLKRYSDNIILAFDADTAGSLAVFRGITVAWNLDMNVKVIVLKEGKDPAEVIVRDPNLWRDAIKESIGVVDFYFDEIFARIDLSRADHKKQAAKKIADIISQLKTKVEQTHYVQLLSRRLDVPEKALWSMVESPRPVSSERQAPTTVYEKSRKSLQLLSEHAIGFITSFGKHLPVFIDAVEPDVVAFELQELYKKVIIYYTANHTTDLKDITNSLTGDELKLWSELVFRGEELYKDLSEREQEHELRQLIARIKDIFYSKKLRELTDAIKRHEAEGRDDMVQPLMQECQSISALRKKLSDEID